MDADPGDFMLVDAESRADLHRVNLFLKLCGRMSVIHQNGK